MARMLSTSFQKFSSLAVFGWCSFGCSQLLSAGGIPARGSNAAGRLLFAAGHWGSKMGGGRATVAPGRWCRPAERLLVASWTAWAAQSSWNRPSSRPAAVSGAAEHGDNVMFYFAKTFFVLILGSTVSLGSYVCRSVLHLYYHIDESL